MDILIVGTGYVGLVTGTCMAEMGHRVICLDIDQEKVARLNNGEIPIYEPGLQELLSRNINSNRLRFTTDYALGVQESKVCFLSVDTPVADDGSANLTFIESAARMVAEHMNEEKLIVIKSTVPPGTAAHLDSVISDVIEKRGHTFDFKIVSNPEFLKEGNAVNDCLKPDRVIIGAADLEAIEIMKEIYAPFMLSHERLFIMDISSAELTKYAANIMLAARISLMNELAGLCERVGANIDKVRQGIGSDTRIGYQFLYAGAGYGGSCLPKDVKAMISLSKKLGVKMELLEGIDQVNMRQKRIIFQKMERYFEDRGGLAGKKFAILGLSFKPDTDDIREASAIGLIEELLKEGASIAAFDPVAMNNAKKALPKSPHLEFASDEISCTQGVDAIVLMTEWKQFRFLDFKSIIPLLNGKVFFDGRNQYLPEKMQKMGFDYISIGKRPEMAWEMEEICVDK